MRIAVMGAGSMGSVYAARLARGGHDVLAISRSVAHVEAINAHGLVLLGPDGEATVPLRAFTSPPAEPVDLVVLAVKAADAGPAAAAVAPMLGERTVVLTIQNGLGAAEEVAGLVGTDRLAVGIASGFGAELVAPGQVRHQAMRAVRLGPYGGHVEGMAGETAEEVAAAWRQGGFDAEAVGDILAMQWEKLICNVAYSALCALTGLTVGEVRDDVRLGPLSQRAAVEAWETARALGVAITVEDPVEHVRAFAAQMPSAKPSALLDLEAGRVSEVGVINGAIGREAAKVGRTAPINDTLTTLVQAREADPR